MKRVIVVAAAFGVAAWMAIAGSLAAAATPRWVRHVQRYPGGISNGVRAYTDSGLQRAQAASKFRSPSVAPVSSQSAGSLQNLQVNSDSNPPLPQNETQIVAQLRTTTGSPWAAANDYVNGGSQIYAHHRRRTVLDDPVPIVRGRGDGRLLRRRRRPGAGLQPARPRLLLRPALLLPGLPAVRDRGDPVDRQRQDLDGVAHAAHIRSRTSARSSATSTRRSSTTRSRSPSTTIRRARTTDGSTSPTSSSTCSPTGSATTARCRWPTPTTSTPTATAT